MRYARGFRTIMARQFMFLLLATFCLSTKVSAQDTTSRLRGVILNASTGDPITDATVTIEHLTAGTSKSTETNAEGAFAFSALRVGGPYKLVVSKSGFNPIERLGLYLKAGSNPSLTLAAQSTETMKVTARAGGPLRSGFYDADDIRNLPSIGQDPKDVVRLNPDAYVDDGKLSIGGANNRFNSLTIDGIRQDDDFGLNNGGYPTQRSPISLYTVEAIQVESSPFDVSYGNFLGGNINVVTKSGENDYKFLIRGSHRNEGLTGNKSKDRKYDTEFEENRFGFQASGPIIEDKLHFLIDIEGLKDSRPNLYGLAGSGKPIEVLDVTAADVERVQAIAANLYGFDAGTVGKPVTEDNLTALAKLDWTITDQQRLEFKYQKVEGNNLNTGNTDRDSVSLTSNWYDKNDILDTMSLRLFSDWNYGLSTKVEVSHKKVVTKQIPLGGDDFMTATIQTDTDGEIILGPDPFRHANELENENLYLKTEATYLMGEHLLTAGVDHESTKVFNLFVPFSNGDADYDSIADFENKTPSGVYYSNAISNNAKDAAADWGYNVSTVYAQDEWQFNQQLVAKYGVRAELYSSTGDITYNQNFYDRYGFDNTSDLNGKHVFLPRLGLNYQYSNDLSFRGGIGLFSGGTPNVWISNNYTNDGITIDSANVDEAPGFDGRNIPDTLTSQLSAGDGNVNVLDPDFEIPRSLKFSLGTDYRFDIPNVTDNINLSLNYTYTKVQYGVNWKDLRRNLAGIENNLPTTLGPDGRPIYDTTPADSSDPGFNPFRGYDLLMTNTSKGFGHVASLKLDKSFQNGLSISGSYAWQRVQDINPGTSSQASSNYGLLAIHADPNNPELARSNYEREHRFLLTLNYDQTFFDNLLTTITLFAERRSGQPYSFTFGGDRTELARMFGESRDFAQRNRMLFYVPKGDGSDVIFGENIDEAAFNRFLAKYGLDKYRGQITPRNAFRSSWVDQIDLRLAQELPGFKDHHRARIMLDINNLPNLLNKKWGQVKQVGFPYMYSFVDVSYDAESGRYIYSNFDDGDPESVRLYQSIWKAQLSAVYEF